jgi:hypothetical protein
MKCFKSLCLFFVISLSINVCGQTKSDRIMLGKANAELELKEALSGKKIHNVIKNKSILIKNRDLAVKIAEPILFDIYGKVNIVKQRPYEMFLIDNYWVISGSLPLKSLGGTFLIIIDSRDAKIIRITHGK